MLYIDIHTHRFANRSAETLSALTHGMWIEALPDGDRVLSVVNCTEHLECLSGIPSSLGIHPWWVDADWRSRWEKLTQRSLNPAVVAVGECGLDKVRRGCWDEQLACFEAHVAWAETCGKPLIIHCVKAYDEVIHMCRKSTVRRIIHGFRGKPQLAAQLLRHGFDLSFGIHYNPDSMRLAYEHHRMWLETDDMVDVDIRKVYDSACSSLNISPTDLVLPGTFIS